MPTLLARRRWWQEDQEFKVRLSYMNLCLNNSGDKIAWEEGPRITALAAQGRIPEFRALYPCKCQAEIPTHRMQRQETPRARRPARLDKFKGSGLKWEILPQYIRPRWQEDSWHPTLISYVSTPCETCTFKHTCVSIQVSVCAHTSYTMNPCTQNINI